MLPCDGRCQALNELHISYQLLIRVGVHEFPSGEALHRLVASHGGCLSF
jgi:hypothetical protein